MKKTLLLAITTFIGSMTLAQDCSDLFISEYVEGWSNNKAIEIYNPTDTDIDLSQYIVVRYSNGSTSATPANAVALIGTIPSLGTHVGVIEKLDQAGTGQEAPVWDSLQARADQFYCPEYSVSNAFYWNGNDVVVLAKGSIGDILNAELIDMFGKLGEDPGVAWTSDFPYTGLGDEVTKDHSMIRKASVLGGVTNIPSFFDPLAEYDSIPAVVDIGGQLYGNWFSLGEHTCDCATIGLNEEIVNNQVRVHPNPSTAEFSVSGISSYSSIVVLNSLGQEVRSINNNSKSVVSFDLSARRGVYFVKLSAKDGSTITKRVIIK